MGAAPCYKILLNGANTASLVSNAINLINPEYAVLPNDKEIIAHLNRMEDDAVELQKMILTGLGYSGDVGKLLS